MVTVARGRIITAMLLLVLAAALAPGCAEETAAGSGDGLSGRLVITGSSTCAPLVSEIARRFEGLHPAVRVDVQTGGSSRGIADAGSGLADIGMTSRALTADEARTLTAAPIARDGVGVIVHAENPVASLSNEQIVGIFTGRIDDWRQVGGRPAPITVVNKAAGRATLAVFTRYFDIDPRTIDADVIIGDNEQGVKTIAGNPSAIGYVSIGTAEIDAGLGVPIRLLPIEGIDATTAALASGRFPISRPLNLVTRGAPSGLAGVFVDYCASEAVHDLVRDLALVPHVASE